MSEPKHPLQPIVTDENSRSRFKANALVRHLLDFGQENGCGMNEMARMGFSKEDWEQFAQLIGYSVDGFAELSYVSAQTIEAADTMVDHGMDPKDAEIHALRGHVEFLKRELRPAVARLYGKHPDDFVVDESR